MNALKMLILCGPLIFGAMKPDIPEPMYPVPLDTELQAHIVHVCDAYNVDPVLVLAVIEKESTYDAGAIGDDGDSCGLMQINAQYHGERMEELGVTKLLNPYCNVLVGIDYLAELLEEYGDVHKALMCYNAGRAGAYQHWFSKGVYENSYSREVMKIAARIGGK